MFEAFIVWLWEELTSASSSFFDLSKRVSFVYLLSAFFFATGLLWLRYGKTGIRRSLQYFSWRTWSHPSARIDYGLWLINQLLLSLVLPKTLIQATLISWLFFFWQEQGMSRFSLGWSDTLVMIVFTFCYFIADDFSRFFVHWSMHKLPCLWAFHQVHHSASVLTPFTVFRTHPVEGVLFFFRSLLVQSIVISLFLVSFPYQITLWQVFGVLITGFIFNFLGANLRHSNVALSYGKKIESWFISPAQHQIHHSKDIVHYDKNFGVILAIWDRIFRSWLSGSDDQEIVYGTGHTIDDVGLFGQYLYPFKYLLCNISRQINGLYKKVGSVFLSR